MRWLASVEYFPKCMHPPISHHSLYLGKCEGVWEGSDERKRKAGAANAGSVRTGQGLRNASRLSRIGPKLFTAEQRQVNERMGAWRNDQGRLWRRQGTQPVAGHSGDAPPDGHRPAAATQSSQPPSPPRRARRALAQEQQVQGPQHAQRSQLGGELYMAAGT